MNQGDKVFYCGRKYHNKLNPKDDIPKIGIVQGRVANTKTGITVAFQVKEDEEMTLILDENRHVKKVPDRNHPIV